MDNFKEITGIDFNTFYADNIGKLSSWLKTKTKLNMLIQEEIVNEAFVRLYNNIEKYDSSKGSLRTFLYNIAFNELLEKRKIENDYQELFNNNLITMVGDGDHNELLDNIEDYNEDYDDSVEKDFELVRSFVNTFKSINQKRAILLWLDGKTTKEISIIMENTYNSTGLLIHKAKLKLRKEFGYEEKSYSNEKEYKKFYRKNNKQRIKRNYQDYYIKNKDEK